MFSLNQIKQIRTVAVAAVLGASLFGAQASWGQKDRLMVPIKNDDVAGTNANSMRAELRGTDLFYSWSGLNNTNAVLFNNGVNGGQNIWTENFAGGAVVGSGQFMLLDTIVDKNAKLARKAEVGVALGPTTLRIAGMNGRDVVTKIDPLNRAVRRAAGNFQDGGGAGFEVVLENGSDDLIFLNALEVRINNTDDLLDFTTPFVPDGTVVTLDQTLTTTSLLPGESVVFSYMGSYDEGLPVSVLASSTLGGDSFTGLLGSHVPEPAMLGAMALTVIPLVTRSRPRRD